MEWVMANGINRSQNMFIHKIIIIAIIIFSFSL